MTSTKTNIVLIGMPGAGKSTVGVILAKKMLRDFVDTDLLIQAAEGRCLQEIVDTDGYLRLREIEEQLLLSLDVQNHVVATGGSAVYSDRAMNYLKSHGQLIFLQVELVALQARVPDYSSRGLAKHLDQSFDELFEERLQLYRRYADITITCAGLTQEQVCQQIILKTAI